MKRQRTEINKDFVVVYSESPSGSNKIVIECKDEEDAFIAILNLRNKAWRIEAYKKIQLKVEVK